MKKTYLFLAQAHAFTAPTTIGVRLATVFFLIAATLTGMSSCQRHPYATFSPTPYQRLAQRTQTPQPIPDSLLTASLSNAPLVTAVPLRTEVASSATRPAKTMGSRNTTLRHRLKRLLSSSAVPPQCDQIVLRNGDVIEAKVKEVGVNEIRYKKCDRPDGPDYTVSKREILSIKYSNGEVERFSAAPTNSSGGSRSSYNNPGANAPDDGPRTDPFAIVALSAGGLAILTGLGAFLLGAAAVVFGALSLGRIRKEPGRFKGKGLAVAGMIAGIVAVAFIVLYIYL